ncbi:PUA-like domain-containing protein [Daldinia caldariorum]|uniref:PUA-like domain-containing protein n=1 Tax=Daldinia caldariorum TaxID=326644 RepID=UPI002008C12D|nr:PUA-like domain-containing protein [Daldinia caldariorum]KAI1463610.1 PUA-like domain-containing protein [Daldinia caldariorum]
MVTVEVFDVGSSKTEQLRHMKYQNRATISLLGAKSKRMKRVVTPQDGPECEGLLKRGRVYLQWLDSIEISPLFKTKATLPEMLQLLTDKPELFYPEDMKASARALHEKWESENWGAANVVDEEETTAEEVPPGGEQEAPIVQSQLPPLDHPTYGQNGIMYGIMAVRGPNGRISYRQNPQVPAKPAKVYGHNDILIGTWFANRLVALHRGVHGSSVGGIAGSIETGAHSIVVSKVYDDLDDDQGETLYYSGSNSHSNEDPNKSAPSSTGTNALKASFRTGRPVRVLRAGGPQASKSNRWLPECGIRYDGLYRVTGLRERKNTKGGLYEQFRLQRESGQPPLEELRKTSPTAQQKRDLYRFQQDY